MNGRETILFIGFDNDYDRLDIEKINNRFPSVCISINKTLRKIISHLSPNRKLFELAIYLLIKSKIKKYSDYKKLIIFKDELDYISLIKKINGKKIIILRNKINDTIKNEILGEKVYTFDEDDSKRYSFEKYNQYTSGLDYIKENSFPIIYDMTFIGKEKGRKSTIDNIKLALRKYSIQSHIVYPQSKTSRLLVKLKIKKSNYLSYTEYINFLLSGSAIIDIIQEGQSNETMRLIEALSANRKVITNNKNILNHPLYSPSNILYFDSVEDLKNNIDSFLLKDFNHIDDEKIKEYSGKEVLTRIISENI